ncbi:type II toxin-antitoxin system HipA family toxin [Phenylobacterium sp.]|uniref:type II toxin-antitoxin system HipA family toxin n=1 Tax=Phenylobacterium sp. TaxID=1871053 RepID=UPI0039833046
MIKSLSVWWDGAVAGALRIDEHGDLAFAYDAGWLADPQKLPVSISLPKRPEPFNRRETRPFFAGLLPEEGQRDAVALALGVSKANDFRLLERLGGDMAGALTLWPEGEFPPDPRSLAATEPLDDDGLVQIIDTLATRPFLAGDEGIRLSLAGAQQKLPVVLVNGRIALPAPGQPSTHILKPPIARLPGTTENEALAMRLAAAIGLKTAPVETRRTGDHPYLLVERYDRTVAHDGASRRLHQEDFCQALAIAPEKKYAAEGGPVFLQCFDLVRNVATYPAPAVLRLLDAAIFNVIVGNADAHGKNFSLLYRAGESDVAPLYDLLCTAAYPGVHAKLAMKIGKRATLEEFTATTWEDFGREINVGAPYVRRRASALAELTLARIEDVADGISGAGFDSVELHQFVGLIRGRAQKVLDLQPMHNPRSNRLS